jgi:hypothetical protein
MEEDHAVSLGSSIWYQILHHQQVQHLDLANLGRVEASIRGTALTSVCSLRRSCGEKFV